MSIQNADKEVQLCYTEATDDVKRKNIFWNLILKFTCQFSIARKT